MGNSSTGLGTNQKHDPVPQPGPPFASNSADNGLSVAPAGEIVLGQNTGQVGNPAVLLSDREIPMGVGPFGVVLNDTLNSAGTRMDGGTIAVSETAGNLTAGVGVVSTGGGGAFLSAIGTNGGSATLNIRTVNVSNDQFAITPDGFGHIQFFAGPIVQIWSVNTSTFKTQIGPTLVTDNTATLQVTGTLTSRRLTSGIAAGTTNIDRDLDSGVVFFNSAAAVLATPNLAGANDRPGFFCSAAVNNAGGITIQLFAGQTVNIGGLVSSAGGTLASTTVGSFATIVNLQGGVFIVESYTGLWVVT